MKVIPAGILSLSLIYSVCAADEKHKLSEAERTGYSIGYQIGMDFKQQEVELNAEILLRGFNDALSGASSALSAEEMQATLVDLKRKIAVEQHLKRAEQTKAYREEGRIFLAENARQEGVKTTESGLQYKVLKPGTGKTPKAGDTVTVKYRGTLINGQEFDSSARDGEPATFRVDELIPGWAEALQLMKEGGKWQLFIPPELAFRRGSPLEHRTILFEVELISVN
jgi:FKBP-type peptidyl-prolyl cis-trans isomerase FklB